MYKIVEKATAQKALRKMQPEWAKRIRTKMRLIAENPYGEHPQVTKLQGREGYRLRVGNYRVLYIIQDNQLVICVLDVLPRGQAYKIKR